MNKGKIFLTDYASYNNGTQFEFGHWVDLDQFDDADELNDYIEDHFEQADKKSPLDESGSIREETMITDFEGFPKFFYSECMNFEKLFEFFEKAEDSNFDIEIIEAFADLGTYNLEEINEFFEALEESYSGEFNNDVDFAMNLHEETGEEIKDSWPHNCINWDSAAREIMFDYCSSDGFYFRSI